MAILPLCCPRNFNRISPIIPLNCNFLVQEFAFCVAENDINNIIFRRYSIREIGFGSLMNYLIVFYAEADINWENIIHTEVSIIVDIFTKL